MILQRIQERSQSWIAWVIVIAISALFALWGIGNFAGGGQAEKSVASVNGEKITDRQLQLQYRRLSDQQRQQFGADVPIDAPKLRKQALQALIENKVLSQGLSDMGFSVASAQITRELYDNPAFKVKGQFSMSRLNALAQNLGLNASKIQVLLANDYVMNQFRTSLILSEFALPKEVTQLKRLIDQQRSVHYALYKSGSYLNQVTLSSAEIKSYYDKHPSQFFSKARVKVAYLLLSLNDIANRQKVTDQQAKSFYNMNKIAFKSPGRRRVSQIFIREPQSLTQPQKVKIEAKISTIQKAIKAGARFSALVSRYSDDIVSKNNGGDLGWITMGQPPTLLEKTVFNLAKSGDVSAPIKTKSGYQIIKLDAIKAPKTLPFDKVKGSIIARLKHQKAQKIYADIGDKLSTMTFENPDSLSYAAMQLKLKLHTSTFFSKGHAPTDINYPSVVKAAFSDNVLQDGNNSDVINLSSTSALVLRKVAYEKPALMPLSKVKAQISMQLKHTKANALAKAKARLLLSALQKGQALQPLLSAAKVTWVQQNDITRRTAPTASLPAALLEAVFNEPRPQKGMPINKLQKINDTGYAVFSLNNVQDGTSSDKKAGYEIALKQSLANVILEDFKAYFKSKASIDIQKT